MSSSPGSVPAPRRWVEVGMHRTPWWTFWSLWTDRGLWQIAWQPPSPAEVQASDRSEQADALDAAIESFFAGRGDRMRSISVDATGWTPFFADVYEACRAIPTGCTVGYGQLAASVGRPRAVRAVGQAMARNRVPLVIPCHRVVGAAGSLGGFSAPGGTESKRRLLELERTASERLESVGR